MASEITPGKGGEEERLSSVRREQRILQGERSFFGRYRWHESMSGVFVTGEVGSVIFLYSFMHERLYNLYSVLARDLQNPTQAAEDAFLFTYLSAQLTSGNLVTDRQVEAVRKKLRSGRYSKQLTGFIEMSRKKRKEGDSDEEEEVEVDPVVGKRYENFGYLASEKQRVLSAAFDLDVWLMEMYGEVDYKNALLVELLLQAPFANLIQNVEPSGIDREARKRHREYVEQVVAIAKEFDLSARIKALNENTSVINPSVDEKPAHKVNDFDREYLMRVSAFARKLRKNTKVSDVELDELYNLLKATVFRRSKFFKAVERGFGKVDIFSSTIDKASFANVVGYNEQTGYLKSLIERTREGDPSVDGIRLVLLVSDPGMGKSLAINAFLDALPENARAIIVNHQRVNIPSLLKKVGEVAGWDPNLQIFLVLEDVEANSDLLKSLLDIESVVPKETPTNVHLIATTNYPDALHKGVLRPGRASEILVYRKPKKEERLEIVRLHLAQRGYHLPDELLKDIAAGTQGFTPDEMVHIVRELDFDKLTKPTERDIIRIINKIKSRRAVGKK